MLNGQPRALGAGRLLRDALGYFAMGISVAITQASSTLADEAQTLFVDAKSPEEARTSTKPTIVRTRTLSARGTMVGLELPIDWSRSNVSTLTVDVQATTDKPLRALYSPYHDLEVTRATDHEATGRNPMASRIGNGCWRSCQAPPCSSGCGTVCARSNSAGLRRSSPSSNA